MNSKPSGEPRPAEDAEPVPAEKEPRPPEPDREQVRREIERMLAAGEVPY